MTSMAAAGQDHASCVRRKCPNAHRSQRTSLVSPARERSGYLKFAPDCCRRPAAAAAAAPPPAAAAALALAPAQAPSRPVVPIVYPCSNFPEALTWHSRARFDPWAGHRSS